MWSNFLEVEYCGFIELYIVFVLEECVKCVFLKEWRKELFGKVYMFFGKLFISLNYIINFNWVK